MNLNVTSDVSNKDEKYMMITQEQMLEYMKLKKEFIEMKSDNEKVNDKLEKVQLDLKYYTQICGQKVCSSCHKVCAVSEE